MDVKETEEQRQMRRIAFVAVVVSTAAVIASVVTLPMLYNYVQSFQSHLMVETDYCKVNSFHSFFISFFFSISPSIFSTLFLSYYRLVLVTCGSR